MESLPDLPKEIWELIFQQLDNLFDRLHFGHVCSFFRSVVVENNPCRLSRVLLMLPPPFPNLETQDFLSLSDSRIYKLQVPEMQDKWCCGSSYGWLFIVDFNSGDINLLNPFTRIQISLPHISTFTNPAKPGFEFEQERNDILYIRKAIISVSPTSNDFHVMVIFTNLWALAFYRPGDKKWTTLATTEWGPCEDVIYYRNKFYAITNWGALIACDLRDNVAPKLTILIKPTHELPYFRYLVESPNGELLKISKLEDENMCTIGFKVHRLVADRDNITSWIEVNSLDDYAVFLGNNRAICLSSKDNPECLGNCIYFTEDNIEKYYYDQDGCSDMGVYKLENGRVEHFYDCHHLWTGHAIWITPSLR